jgi:(heptosyl)LPS beta-1,4-glucosyltransferase
MRQKVSFFILTLNEEKNIEACLKSIAWADEIVIGDTGSTDNTLKIARKYTKKIYRIPFLGHAKSKEMLSKKTTNEWVFSFDADERVTELLKKEIIDFLQNDPKTGAYEGMRVLRWNYFWGKPMHCWHPDYQMRFYRKSRGKWNSANIHCGVMLQGKTISSENYFEHYTDPDLFQFLRKMNPYTTSDAVDLTANPEKMKKVGVGAAYLRGIATFCKFYIARRGFMDGKAGFVLSFYLAIHNITRYLKAYEFKTGISKVPPLEKMKSIF